MAQPFTQWRSSVGLLVCLAFVTIAAFRIRSRENQPIAWFCLLFFGAAAIGWAYSVLTEIMSPAFEPMHRVLYERGDQR